MIEWVCLSGGSGEEESMYIVIWVNVSCFVSVVFIMQIRKIFVILIANDFSRIQYR